jgi:hypothetical protein
LNDALLNFPYSIPSIPDARCLADARRLDQAHNVCHAVAFAGCLLPAITGHVAALIEHSSELKKLTTVHGLPFWRGHADLFAGLAAIAQGATEDGFAQARQGVDTLISVRAFSNVWYIVYADACARAGRVAEGAEILSVAEHSITQGDAWLAPEFFRLRGRLRFANGEGEEAARQDFRTALEIAEKQGAQLFSEAARRELAALAIGEPRSTPDDDALCQANG